MKITQSQVVAKSKNGRVDFPALAAEIEAAHGTSVSASSDDKKGWRFRDLTAAQVDAALASHEGDPLPDATDEPARVYIRAGKVYAQGESGEPLLLGTLAP